MKSIRSLLLAKKEKKSTLSFGACAWRFTQAHMYISKQLYKSTPTARLVLLPSLAPPSASTKANSTHSPFRPRPRIQGSQRFSPWRGPHLPPSPHSPRRVLRPRSGVILSRLSCWSHRCHRCPPRSLPWTQPRRGARDSTRAVRSPRRRCRLSRSRHHPRRSSLRPACACPLQ
jgi:hypothetical protein